MKEKLLEIIKNPANKLIAVDLDGTLCEGQIWSVGDKVFPLLERINFVNSLYKKGAHIIIWTARQPELFVQTLNWLNKHGVLFHGITMRTKIGADLYLDDKALNIEDVIKL